MLMKSEVAVLKKIDELMNRYPELIPCGGEILKAYEIIVESYMQGGKLLCAGNGGSAADCEHIVGELMKSFNFKRKAEKEFSLEMQNIFGEAGIKLASTIEGALPAVSLPSLMSLQTAYSNDNDPQAVFAQMVYGLGSKEDVLLVLSTSGNSQNILNACMVASVLGIKIVGLSGSTGGKLKEICNVTICVPADRPYTAQEYHLPVYHALCAMLEERFFGKEKL